MHMFKRFNKHQKQFKDYGYTIIRDLYPVKNHTKRYTDLFKYTNNLPVTEGDQQSPGAPAYYGENEIKKVHIKLLPKIEAYTGVKLYPTTNYMRIYNKTSSLPPHKDKPHCEISCTLTIGSEGEYVWPISLTDYFGNDVTIKLGPGDGLLYRGADLMHWRNPSDAKTIKQTQAFLHYVDQDGPYEDYLFNIEPPRSSR